MVTYYIGADVHCNNTDLEVEQRSRIVATVPTIDFDCALKFDLPLFTSMMAAERVILKRDLNAFKSAYTPVGGTKAIPWVSDNLDNGGETIEV